MRASSGKRPSENKLRCGKNERRRRQNSETVPGSGSSSPSWRREPGTDPETSCALQNPDKRHIGMVSATRTEREPRSERSHCFGFHTAESVQIAISKYCALTVQLCLVCFGTFMRLWEFLFGFFIIDIIDILLLIFPLLNLRTGLGHVSLIW